MRDVPVQPLALILGGTLLIALVLGLLVGADLTSLTWFAIIGGLPAAAEISQPREASHLFSIAIGLAALTGAVASALAGMPAVLPVFLFTCGAATPYLAWRSWQGSRVCWSFLTTICGVLAVCLLFGAPKVKALLHLGLWPALAFPAILAGMTVTLAFQHERYKVV